MNIDKINRIGQTNPYKHNQQSQAFSRLKKKTKDEVLISDEAKKLLNSQKAARPNTANSPQRVEALKQAVTTGTYHVEANHIAEKLLPYLK